MRRRRLLTPEQTDELESHLGDAVSFLLGARALMLTPADRLSFCATFLLSKLGECAPPPQPPQPHDDAPSDEALRVAHELKQALEEALLQTGSGDPVEPPMRRVARALLAQSVALELREQASINQNSGGPQRPRR